MATKKRREKIRACRKTTTAPKKKASRKPRKVEE